MKEKSKSKSIFQLVSANFRFRAESKKVTSRAELKILQLELWLEPARLGLITNDYALHNVWCQLVCRTYEFCFDAFFMVIQIMYAPRCISMYVKEFVNVKRLKVGVKMSRFIISRGWVKKKYTALCTDVFF